MTHLYERYTNKEAATYINGELARTAKRIHVLAARKPDGPLSMELAYMAALDQRQLCILQDWESYLCEKLAEVLDE